MCGVSNPCSPPASDLGGAYKIDKKLPFEGEYSNAMIDSGRHC